MAEFISTMTLEVIDPDTGAVKGRSEIDLRNGIILSAAPTTSTPGRVGMSAYVTSGGAITAEFVCTGASGGVYTWVKKATASGGGGEDSIFMAEYETTPYDEIRSAHNTGKIVILRRGNLQYVLAAVTSVSVIFTNVQGVTLSKITVSRYDEWVESSSTINTGSVGDSIVKTPELPEFAETIEECTDPEKLYVLPPGYIYAYGTRYVEKYKNIFPTLEGEIKGVPYNGVGYKDNTYMNYEPNEKGEFEIYDYPEYFLTGFIPYNANKVFRARNVPWETVRGDHLIFAYDKDKNHIGVGINSASGYIKIEENGDIITDTYSFATWLPGVEYIRLCVYVGIDTTKTPDFDSMIMTIDQVIEEEEVVGFHDTGIAYMPADNEDRIIVLEEAVEELKEKGGGNVTFDYAAYGLPELALSGDVTGMDKENEKELDYVYGYYTKDETSGKPVYGERSGTCTCKWQGSSSIAYPKKNYTIKFKPGFEAFEKYGDQKKYCFKANYIDHSHARNIVCARLWVDIVRSRKNENPENTITTLLAEIPNCGAINGFPCVITINGEYQGLYTFNIPKDGWMFKMGGNEDEAIICAENDKGEGAPTRFENHADIGVDFSLEYALDEDNADWVEESLNILIDKINEVYDNNGADMDETLSDYIDLESAIDYYIFTTLVGGLDMTNKNYLLVTYDGTKWFFSAYDMDSTFGLNWDGKSFIGADWYGWGYYQEVNRLMYLIYTYKREELKARYARLRSGALSVPSVVLKYNEFVCGIPERIYLSDTEVWPTIPSSSASNLAQITSWYQERARVIDAQVEAWG